jgi:diamine N-acetyltransferase
VTVELREVTKDNLRAVMRLTVAASQRALVADNAQSIAEAHFEPNAWFHAIYAGEDPVGFVQGIDVPEERFVYVWRMMIDAAHQGRGHGAAAMQLVIERARALEGIDRVVLSHSAQEGNAGPFYERLGFTPTGEVEGDEIVVGLSVVDGDRRA